MVKQCILIAGDRQGVPLRLLLVMRASERFFWQLHGDKIYSLKKRYLCKTVEKVWLSRQPGVGVGRTLRRETLIAQQLA